MSAPITERDKKLLKQLHDYGLLTTGQIQREFFSEIAQTTFLRRLRMLRKRKLIRRYSGLNTQQYVWSVDKAGAKLVGSIFYLNSVNRNTLEHDVTVSEVRFHFEKIMGGLWKSGHWLKAQAGKNLSRDARDSIADSVFTAETARGKTVTLALEVELVLKAKVRYFDVFRGHTRGRVVSLIWYIAPDDGVGKTIINYALEYGRADFANSFAWTNLSDLYANGENAVLHFHDREGAIREFFKVKTKQTEKSRMESITRAQTLAQGVSRSEQNQHSQESKLTS